MTGDSYDIIVAARLGYDVISKSKFIKINFKQGMVHNYAGETCQMLEVLAAVSCYLCLFMYPQDVY